MSTATTQIIELDSREAVAMHSPLWNSPMNQLRRKIGRFTIIYNGGVMGGTVHDESGRCWDWWPTDKVLSGNFREIRVVEAR